MVINVIYIYLKIILIYWDFIFDMFKFKLFIKSVKFILFNFLIRYMVKSLYILELMLEKLESLKI